MDLLHEYCGGRIETFSDDNYGLCQECGEEGYFRIVREEEDAHAVFYEVTCTRETPV